MLKQIHKQWSLSLSIMLALLMTMVATPATAELPDILESGKIRIAVPENFPPFGSLGEEGEYVGYDVEIAQMIADDLGVELELVPVTSKQRIPFLETDKVEKAIKEIVNATKSINATIILGAPLSTNSGLYNAAFVIKSGTIVCAIPKVYLPNYSEYYEKRYFDKGNLHDNRIEVNLGDFINKNYKMGRKPPRLNRFDNNLSQEEQENNKIWQQVRAMDYLNDTPVIQFIEPGIEADDVISYIKSMEHFTDWQKVIVSSDKDFIQLQKYNFVSQYSPMQKKYVNGIDPTTYIKEHILKGDRGDGVPNFLSPDNTFVDELRQRPMSKRKLEAWIDLEPSDYCNEEMMRNYQRNRTLIDLSYIPDDIKEKCTQTFLDAPEGSRKHLLNYFIKKKLKSLMENIGDF